MPYLTALGPGARPVASDGALADGALARSARPGTSRAQVSKSEFRDNVREMGIEAEAAELNDLFESLDEDGGGSLDLAELKATLTTLREVAMQTAEEERALEKSTVVLRKAALKLQKELHRIAKAEAKAEAAAEAERLVKQAEEAAAEAEAVAAAKAKKAAAMAAKEAEKRAFEEKVAARRA